MEPTGKKGATAASENPFFVLEISPHADHMEIARQKQKLLGMLELGLASAQEHDTPLGPQPRTSESVRRAAACLDRPQERILWELWATGLCNDPSSDEETSLPELRRALTLHYQLQRQLLNESEFEVEEFEELGDAWGEVLYSDDFFEEVLERTVDLDLDEDPQEIVDEFSEVVESDLVSLLEGAPACDMDAIESELGIDAVGTYSQRACELLEASCERFVQTEMHQRRLRDAWNALEGQYIELATERGEYLRSLAFYAIEDQVSDFAVVVHEEGFYWISELLFRWLRDEAELLGDDEIFQQQSKNLRIAKQAQVETTTYEPYEQDVSAGGGGTSMYWIAAVIAMGALRLCARDCNDTPDYVPPADFMQNYNFDRLHLDESEWQNSYSPPTDQVESLPEQDQSSEEPAAPAPSEALDSP